MTDHRIHGRTDADVLLRQLAAWEAGGGHVRAIHVGDVSWAFRNPDDHPGRVHGWWRGDRLVAAAIVEDGVARPRVAPDLVHDEELAETLADALESLPGDKDGTFASEAMNGTRLRQVLALRGWEPDPETWTALYAPPSAGVATDRARPAAEDPAARVDVQRHGFTRSTFDLDAWERMAALPTYDASLDLVLRDADGVAVAAGTAWLAGTGSAVVEPFSVHRDHRRLGHGTTLTRALVAACAARGASGVSVCTPTANPGAVTTYRSGGFRVVETLQDLVRPRR